MVAISIKVTTDKSVWKSAAVFIDHVSLRHFESSSDMLSGLCGFPFLMGPYWPNATSQYLAKNLANTVDEQSPPFDPHVKNTCRCWHYAPVIHTGRFGPIATTHHGNKSPWVGPCVRLWCWYSRGYLSERRGSLSEPLESKQEITTAPTISHFYSAVLIFSAPFASMCAAKFPAVRLEDLLDANLEV